MEKRNLINKIKQLEGLSNDEKAYLVNLVNTKKKYGLVWEDKPEDVEEQLRTQLPVLREVVDRRIEASPNPSKGGEKEKTAKTHENLQQSLFEPENIEQSSSSSSLMGRPGGAPNHILIEGDNLHALTALTFTHEGQIDVMYFDPPYNTGNKDFKYNDNFVDREDSYRHSKWLSFMDKRLKIAKRLLSEKGVIFISIDDNEVAQLILLCNEIFGEENFIQDLIWFNKYTISNDAKYFSKQHDYVLVYAKNIMNANIQLLSRTDEANKRYKNPDNDPRGQWKATPLDARSGSQANIFEIIFPNGVKWRPTAGRFSVHNKAKLFELYQDNRIWFGKNNDTKPSKKTFLKEVSQGMKCGSILPYNTFGHTHRANDQLSDIIGKGKFTSPKSLELINRLIFLSSNKNSIILDIFAGSGTTLHATMQLNAEDGGNRQCILVTNNENNIAEEVCYERNKRVIQAYTNSKGVDVPGLTNNNLRYYKSEFVGREPSLKNKKELTQLATELLCIKEDCYNSLNHDLEGLKDWQDEAVSFDKVKKALKNEIRLFSEKEKKLMVIYNEEAIEEAVALVKYLLKNKSWKSHHPVNQSSDIFKVYVFANGQYAYAEEFEEIADSITLAALPDAIYKAYQNILPKENREFVPELEEELPVEFDSEPTL